MLLPLRFDLSAGPWAQGEWLATPGWSAPSLDDAITNIVVCVPIGLLLHWSLHRRPGRRWVRIALCGLIVGIFSYLIESIQTLLPGRVSAWSDVCANALGGLLGAAAGPSLIDHGRRLLASGYRQARDRPARACFWAAVAVISLDSWLPFDLRWPQKGLASAQWLGFGQISDLPTAAQGDVPLASILTLLRDIGLLFVLGWLAGLAHRHARQRRSRIFLAAGWRIALLVVGWEAAQLCIASHTFASGTIVVRLISGLLGVALAIRLPDRPDSTRGRTANPAGPGKQLLGAAIVAQAALLLLRSATPAPPATGPVGMHWLPFYNHFQQSFPAAIATMWDQTLPYVLLALSIAAFFGPGRSVRLWPWLICAAVVLVAQSQEAMSCWHVADITDVLLAGVGTTAGVRIYRRLVRQTPGAAEPARPAGLATAPSA